MMVTHTLTMDLSRCETQPTLDMFQYDQFSRQVAIFLTCDGQPLTIPGDTRALVCYTRGDGVSGCYDSLGDGTPAWSVSENCLTLTIAPEALRVEGITVVSVRLIRGERVLHTCSFYIQVDKAPHIKDPGQEHRICWYLPMPSPAAQGQFLRAAQVDENGFILRLEAADAPAFDTAQCDFGQVTAQKLRITGRFTIDYGIQVNLNGSRIQNLGTPTQDSDAATKAYVDQQIANALEALGIGGN